MKLKIKKTTETEISIDLPYFGKKTAGGYIAIISETQAIEISEWEQCWIIKTNASASVFSEPHTQITRDEFNAEYERIVDAIYDDMQNNIQALNLFNEDITAADPAMDEIEYQQKQSM